ncbi:MAG: hypothetical protein Q9176_005077 [Flavoplaca citrina]
MPQTSIAHRRVLLLAVSAIGILALLSVFFRSAPQRRHFPSGDPLNHLDINPDVLKGKAVAGKIANETIKAELGRSAWRLLHTTMSSYPLHPSTSEKAALSSYVHLFARLYPCGQCASHFQQILVKYPPQVGGRKAAEMWGCTVHNEVNKSLGKDIFDCARVGEVYDCGCGDDEEKGEAGKYGKGGGEIRVEEERIGNLFDKSYQPQAQRLDQTMMFPLKRKLSRWKKSRSSKDADNRTEDEYHRDIAAAENRKFIKERNNNADHDDGTAKDNAKSERYDCLWNLSRNLTYGG